MVADELDFKELDHGLMRRVVVEHLEHGSVCERHGALARSRLRLQAAPNMVALPTYQKRVL
jgi:hypothetical protein